MPEMPPAPELWNPRASICTGNRPVRPDFAANQAMPVHQQLQVQSMGTCHAATRSAHIEASYFPSCLTSDPTFVNDKWDSSLQVLESGIIARQYKDLGLGLDAFDNDRTPTAASYDTAECFLYPHTSIGQQFPHLGAPSPDQRSLSSFSEASSGCASEHAELPRVSEYSYFSANNSSTFELAPPAPEGSLRSSQHTFEAPPHGLVAEPLSRHSCRALPHNGNRFQSQNSSSSSLISSKPRRSPPFVHNDANDFPFQDLDFSAQNTFPSILSSSDPSVGSSSASSSVFCSETHLEQSSFLFHTPRPKKFCQPHGPPAHASSGTPNILHSDSQVENRHEGRATDCPGPPDLFGALREDHTLPPEKDMDPSDPELRPCEQELRFEGDLHTPRFVRGLGNKREGWCGICKPGRWLVMKNSGYWYDRRFRHGVSAAGATFDGPSKTRRMEGRPEVWEGLCNSCGNWIELTSSKKKGTTWFRHAYKCHTRPKLTDAPKKRRGVSHARASRPEKLAKLAISPPGSSASSPDSKVMRPADVLGSPGERDC